jgi:pimeloyl-ACP methyl ester carboxylesterase
MAKRNYAFLHGGGQGSWVWNETIAALKQQSGGAVECLALDVPGCGTKRGRNTAAIGMDDIANELIADIERWGLREVILVGHSQAGSVLPRIAEYRPDLLGRLVYVTCTAPTQGMTTAERMGSGLHGQNEDEVGWPVDPATTTMEERFRAMFCSDMNPAEADRFFAKLGQDMWPASSYSNRDWRYDHLGAIPSAFVLCLRDMSLPPVWQERFAEAFKVDRTICIDAGHQVMNTRPQALAEVLLAEASG